MRQTFVRSLAVSSFLGWVVGLGDRHLNNILLETTTCTLVPIDFGVLLDCGRCLPLPELVPFRLTPNLIACIGPQGVESGAFVANSVACVRQVQEAGATVESLLSAFVFDPLIRFAKVERLMKNQSCANQNSSSDVNNKSDDIQGNSNNNNTTNNNSFSTLTNDGNSLWSFDGKGSEIAKGRLAAVRKRLKGYSDKLGVEVEVEEMVRSLIDEAVDSKNLSKMFVGWSAWV